MKLTITVEANQIPDGLKMDRRRLNNIWSNATDIIHYFLINDKDKNELNQDLNMGIQPYQLTVKIED